ncbi:MAG TPA: DUF6798 domain-containing protein [Stellaceae bacterium]|nr:DUF6798 domain-containing protein [Stellaceae bacterium]
MLKRELGALGVLLVVLLILIPPDGMLSDNEENYFALAAKLVGLMPDTPYSAVFDASRHRVLADFLLGHVIALTGFETAQIALRLLVCLLFALVLRAVFRLFSLQALDGLLVLVGFAALGQTLIGGEWLFNGVEAKVAAYLAVLAGLYWMMTRREVWLGTLMLALATWFHFLVGGFWFLSVLFLRLLGGRDEWKPVLRSIGVYAVTTAPLFVLILADRWRGLRVSGTSDIPSPDIIYSFIRAPHHLAPFLNANYFLTLWLPGFLLAGAMLAAAFFMAHASEDPRFRRTSLWGALLLGYLFLAVGLSFLDRDTGFWGKFYLFRPASLILLLWIVILLAFLNELRIRTFTAIKVLAVLFIAPSLLLHAGSELKREIDFHATYDREKHALAEFLAENSGPDAVILIDPALESSFIDFERITHRPSLVMWKFDPTNDHDLGEWYRRQQFRESLFTQGCAGDLAYPVDFLLTTTSAKPGPAVYASAHLRLLRLPQNCHRSNP